MSNQFDKKINYYKPFSINAPVLSRLPIPIIPLIKNPNMGPVALLKPWFKDKEVNLDLIKPKCNLPFPVKVFQPVKVLQPVKIFQAVQAVQAVINEETMTDEIIVSEDEEDEEDEEEEIKIIKKYKSYGNKYQITVTNRGFMCDLCGKIYKDLAYIQSHQKDHNLIMSGKRYQCDKCSCSYMMKKHLNNHITKKHK